MAELLRKAKNGDKEARARIVKENSGLIWSTVKRFSGRGTDMEDLFQIGSIGLIKSIDRFDESFGVKFSTYAVPMIIGEIRRFLRDDGIIKVSRNIKELSNKIKTVSEAIFSQSGKWPTISELSKIFDVPKDELVTAMESGKDVESLYRKSDEENGKGTYLIDTIKNSDSTEKADEIMSLKEALDSLDSREKQLILMRYYFDRTQSETGRKMNISQVQVSRMEKRILDKMRQKLV
ncbi:MAG: SigB/SigF/SigG family RNA polymerase sigma factor [Clostridia bacterium]|jgi:RNA polymerase sporulation-specific sigma factor|nr:SigB/SigF/SigG family RNA polymerase sigma factor [Clostridia bacterium]MCI1960025.1 SigB/SigF/SigG family RNA polymerase sigma factor [Clostridia bacterium]MCI2000211.1 SigB/SigF/SigG family RNA polymerase sigma factor [Clostridia bacterium]MCI2014624.1 SigB/SigF/SigG family RNA polymerase sigma factor [Clostridia bacterium]